MTEADNNRGRGAIANWLKRVRDELHGRTSASFKEIAELTSRHYL